MWKRQRACCESFAPSVIGWMGRSAKKRTETCHRRHANGDNKSILREWLPQMVDMLAQNRERKGRQWMFGGLFPGKTWLGAVHGVSSTIQKKYMSTRSCCWVFFFLFSKGPAESQNQWWKENAVCSFHHQLTACSEMLNRIPQKAVACFQEIPDPSHPRPLPRSLYLGAPSVCVA